MRDTHDRQLQLDFQRRAPEPKTDCSSLAARASSALHDARLTSVHRRPGRCRRFLPLRTLALLTSDVPLPLPRQRVNDAGFNASSGHLRSLAAAASPSLTFASAGLARPLPPSAATDGVRERTRQRSPNFCNRSQARAHWRTIVTRRRAAFHDEASHLAVLRRCETAPTVQVRSQLRARHGRRLWSRIGHPVADPGPGTLEGDGEIRSRSRPTVRTPRERTNPRKRARMPFAVRDPSVSIRTGLAGSAELAPAERAPLVTREPAPDR
jgi:hypothetical protein